MISKNDDYVFLRTIELTNKCKVELFYDIEKEKLFVMKSPYSYDLANSRVSNRETRNYQEIMHAFLPNFYGKNEAENSILIEYIEGKSLENITNFQFNEKEKFTIILQLLSVIKYLHDLHYIYRDLKPNNVMIDNNRTLVLIDFDLMIKDNVYNYSHDLCSEFRAPEIDEPDILTAKCDIYSIGKMIYYIISEKNPNNDDSTSLNDYPEIESIYKKCINKNSVERPCISEIINDFYHIISKKNIILDNILPEDQFQIGYISYQQKDYEKSIKYYTLSANSNYFKAQFNLGIIYHVGIKPIIEQNIEKSFHYFHLAATKNDPRIQFILGLIYYKISFITNDIEKSIYYLKLSSDQNYKDAQYYLGLIYTEINKVEKAIEHFLLASNQNDARASYYLGKIFYLGLHVKQDIEKSIHFFSLAINNSDPKEILNLDFINHDEENYTQDLFNSLQYFDLSSKQKVTRAYFYLGVIYYNYKRNIDEAIKYFKLSADQNDPEAQYNLGTIFFEGRFVLMDIDKAIYYFNLASSQNIINAQYNLGVIFFTGQYAKQNIEKSIYYFTLAANNNEPNSQYFLGLIYSTTKFNKFDIDKAINYLTLASNQNNVNAQFHLGLVYYQNKNIKKSIQYLSLASKQNFIDAHIFLASKQKNFL